MVQDSYSLQTKLWLYPGNGGWHFVTISSDHVVTIRQRYNPVKRGWGSIPVEVTIGKSRWKTSIFPSKDGTYVLPVKLSVRKQEKITDGDTVILSLRVID